jgi:hypothetical protein
MQRGKTKIITVYVLLPLLILAFSLGALELLVSANSENTPADYMSGRAFSTLATRPVSLLTPYSSGDIYNEMLSVKDVFDEYNERYPNRLSVSVAKGSRATLSKMKYYISTTERMHLASHGTWSSSEGPKITMYGIDLTKYRVASWSLTGGQCKVIYLSACNSMGHNGILDTSLADRLKERTSANSVVGFKDVANIVGATLLSQSFWMFHVAYHSTGGFSTWGSYTSTRDRINRRVVYLAAITGISLSAAVSLLIGEAASGVGWAFIAATVAYITSWVVYYLLLAEIRDAVNNWEIVGDSVSGLRWTSGGGGGMDPKDVTH